LTHSHPRRLLTTRLRTAAALGLTGLALAVTIRFLGHPKSGWLLSLNFVLHGWSLMIVNVGFYALFVLAWILVRSSHRRTGALFHAGLVRRYSAIAA
jgi:hypothetical protein